MARVTRQAAAQSARALRKRHRAVALGDPLADAERELKRRRSRLAAKAHELTHELVGEYVFVYWHDPYGTGCPATLVQGAGRAVRGEICAEVFSHPPP